MRYPLLRVARPGRAPHHGGVRWRDNPLYRPSSGIELRGRGLWLWRLVEAALLALLIITADYRIAAPFVVLWLIAELRLRGRRKRSAADSEE